MLCRAVKMLKLFSNKESEGKWWTVNTSRQARNTLHVISTCIIFCTYWIRKKWWEIKNVLTIITCGSQKQKTKLQMLHMIRAYECTKRKTSQYLQPNATSSWPSRFLWFVIELRYRFVEWGYYFYGKDGEEISATVKCRAGVQTCHSLPYDLCMLWD